MSRTLLLVCALWLGATDMAPAHPGGLDSRGCHHNRKTGDYHCHRAQAAAGPGPVAAPPARATVAPARAAPSNAAPSRAYANCSEARAAGAAPVRRGDPGYGAHLDRDNDGVGCE